MNYDQILKSQKEFFNSPRTKETAFRKDHLLKLKHILKDNEHLLFKAIYKDFHKSEFDAYANEFNLIYREIDYFLKHLNRLSKPRKVKTGMALLPGKSYIYYEPLGCVFIIGAWNYPYSLTLIPLVNSMAAGNTNMIKPSELPRLFRL